jgi:hypothetical protein
MRAGGGRIYFIFRFRHAASPSPSSALTQEGEGGAGAGGEGKLSLSPVLGVPMRTPPPPHPIVLCLDDSWGEIITAPAPTPPEKTKERAGLFARAKAKLSGKKLSQDLPSPSPPPSLAPSPPPVVTYRAKSMAHEFFEALQCASMPDTHFYGSEHFLTRSHREPSNSFSRSSDQQAADLLLVSSSSPLISSTEMREGADSWSGSQVSAGYGTSTSGLTSVESLLSGSQRTSVASYQTSRSSQSGFRISFLAPPPDRDSLQSSSESSSSSGLPTPLSRSLPKNYFEPPAAAAARSLEVPKTKTTTHASSYTGRSTFLLGRVAEEREDRSTSNDSSSLSHNSSQLMGLTLTPEHFHDCARSHHKEVSRFTLTEHTEDDEESQDHEDDWKSVGSERQLSTVLSAADKAEEEAEVEVEDMKPFSPPSLLTLSLQNSSTPMTQPKADIIAPPLTPAPTTPFLVNEPHVEAYSCPSTNYIPSALEGYGPIRGLSPVPSPLRRTSRSGSYQLSSPPQVIRKQPSSETSDPMPTVTQDLSLSQHQPVESIMRYLSPPPGLSSSFSLFGESIGGESFRDPGDLTADLPPQRTPPLMPSRSMTVSFKLPDGLLESEGDDRLSCSSLPAFSRSLPDSHLSSSKKKTGHSFSHSEENKKETSPSRVLFDRSLAPAATPRHVAFTLTQELNSIREQRKDLESSLIACVTERENLLQVLRYLQSLRRAVKHPPSAPTESHSSAASHKTRHSELSGAVGGGAGGALRTTTRKKYAAGGSRESSGDLSSDSASSHSDRNLSHLSALLYAAVSNGLEVPVTEGQSSRQLSTDSVFREERLPSSGGEGGKVPHISEAEEFVYNLLSSSAPESGSASRSDGRGSLGSKNPNTLSKRQEKGDDGFLSLSLSQQIGPPPPALANEFER